jgi:hypothetical protein
MKCEGGGCWVDHSQSAIFALTEGNAFDEFDDFCAHDARNGKLANFRYFVFDRRECLRRVAF